MKKSIFLISVIAIAFSACKKDKDETPTPNGTGPTTFSITSSDIGNAGDIILMNVDNTNLPPLSLAAGQNLTWDISMLGVDEVDTIAFLNPANTPGHSYFTNTNLA
ncbi:MAG: hypothetical protein ACUVQP_10620, partial [Bacteroidales bacterium]